MYISVHGYAQTKKEAFFFFCSWILKMITTKWVFASFLTSAIFTCSYCMLLSFTATALFQKLFVPFSDFLGSVRARISAVLSGPFVQLGGRRMTTVKIFLSQLLRSKNHQWTKPTTSSPKHTLLLIYIYIYVQTPPKKK